MARAHLYMTIVDDQGNLQKGAEVRLLQPNTVNPITVPIYESDTGPTVIGNPWTADNGIIDVYLDNPMRVRIGMQIGNSVEQYIENIDVGSSGGGGEGDYTHPGVGANSTSVGANAQATGTDSVALGVNSSAGADKTTSIGQQAISAQTEGTAIGWHAQANGDGTFSGGSEANATASGAIALGKGSVGAGTNSTAIGRDSTANNAESVAIGHNANASHDRSIAFGAGSMTTTTDQIVLGTSNHEVYVPGVLTLRSSGGNDYEIRVADNGTLYSGVSISDSDVQILPATDQSFGSGVGGWTSTGATLSVTTDNEISPNPILTMNPAQGTEAFSSVVSAQDGSSYLGEIWAYATGDFEIHLVLDWMSDATTVIDSTSMIVVPAISGQWIRVSSQGAAPSGTTGVRLHVSNGASESSQILYIESAGLYQRT